MRPLDVPTGPTAARRRPQLADDRGWVMVPVMVLLAVGLLLCFAALLLVDRQTQASASERTSDAAATLAEGAATATAGVLAGDESNPVWLQRFTSCQSISGDLAGAPAATTPRTLTSAVQTAVNAYFDAATSGSTPLSEYDTRGGRATTWRVQICPTTDSTTVTDTRWDTSRPTSWTAPGIGTGTLARRQTLWVVAQGNVRKDATGGPGQRRAVAAKVQRGASLWKPPTTFALATGSYDNDLGAVTGQVLSSVTQTVGQQILGGALGTKGLLGRKDDVISDSTTDDDANKGAIGVRCGLLQGADNTVKHITTSALDLGKLDLNLCLAGSFAGLNGVTGRVGLNTLLDPLLGTNRFQNLAGYSISATGVPEAYRDEAKAGDTGGTVGLRTGIYRDSIAGKTYKANDASTVELCNLPWDQMDNRTVVFVEQIGNGDQTCVIEASRLATVRALVVNRGRIVVRGRLNGVLYALNGQECVNAGATGCTADYRANQPTREIVRIEGGTLADNTKVGRVTGAVWVDGVRGQVGLYPAAQPSSLGGALGPLLSSAAAPVDSTLCALPILGTLLKGVTGLLTDVVTLITGGTQTAALPSGSAGPPSDDVETQKCGLIRATVGSLANLPGLAAIVSNGDKNVPYTYDRWEKCIPGLAKYCSPADRQWRNVGTGSTTGEIKPGLLDAVVNLSLVANLQTLLTSLSGDTSPLIVRDTTTIAAAKVSVADNATFVPGTFRNLPAGS